MVFGLAQHAVEDDAASAVPGSLAQHGKELGEPHMKGARCGHQGSAGTEEPHGPQVDFSIASERRSNRRPRLGKGRRIQHHGLEPLPSPFQLSQGIEGVGLPPLDVVLIVEGRIGLSPRQGLGARIDRYHVPGALCQVEGEGAMVGEAVERPTAGGGEPAREQPIASLVEKRAGLLSGPRCGEVSHRGLADLDFLGHVTMHQLRFQAQPLPPANRRVVAQEHTRGLKLLHQRIQDHRTHALQPSREELHHQPAVIAIDHQ
jgi:hypothetical protein